jgi:D-threo-aldose 1-dehydrogenase
MNPLEKARIGRTNLTVSRLGLGTAALPGLYAAVDRGDAIGAIRQALARGLNLIDTAPMYGHGMSEELLGEALAGVPRESYVLSTKVGRLLAPEDPVKMADSQWRNISPYRWYFDFSREAILRSHEESLKRMKVDRVDILLIHDPDDHWEDAIRFAYPAIHRLREEGTVKAIGAGMNQWQMLKRFAEEGDFDCFLLAGRYTLLDRTAEPEFLPVCERKGTSILIGGPYNSGILAGGTTFNYAPAPAEMLERVARMRRVCDSYGVDLKAAALQFPFRHPAVAATIPGARTAVELDQNVQLLQTEIPSELWKSLESLAGL